MTAPADDPGRHARALSDLRRTLGADYVPGASDPDPWRIPLSTTSYGTDEIVEVLDSLLSGRVTKGAKVERFEREWAAYVGRRHALMVNSGSSANLLALSALASPLAGARLAPGDEVISGAVGWLTTFAPIVQVGAIPVFVDIHVETLNLDLEQVEAAITPRTRAIMPVHVLGRPVAASQLMAIALRHDLIVIEDCCEAHGAEVDGRKVGSFGDAATFSFYFSHHITTVEGGMFLTDDDRLADAARSLRAHGWRRELAGSAASAEDGDFGPSTDWSFISSGYNFRPTEFQGAFGIHQLPRLDAFIEQRRETAHHWTAALSRFANLFVLPSEDPGSRHVWFGYPLVIRPEAPFDRRALVSFLASAGIATRPIISGNITAHPVAREWRYRISGELANAQLVHQRGLMIGNHRGVGERERALLVDTIKRFVDGQVRPRS